MQGVPHLQASVQRGEVSLPTVACSAVQVSLLKAASWSALARQRRTSLQRPLRGGRPSAAAPPAAGRSGKLRLAGRGSKGRSSAPPLARGPSSQQGPQCASQMCARPPTVFTEALTWPRLHAGEGGRHVCAAGGCSCQRGEMAADGSSCPQTQRTRACRAAGDGPACWACRPTDVPVAPCPGAYSLHRASLSLSTYTGELGGRWRPP